jgi:hypothetical protein
MSALGDALTTLKGVLDAHTDGWFVFGAQAVGVRGSPRTTQDVDVTVSVPPERITALVGALRGAGFSDRQPDQARELLRNGGVMVLLHDETGFDVDIVLAGSGLEALALSRATVTPLAGVEVPVAHATDLVVMKVLAGRAKDVDDVISILRVGEVDRESARDLLGQLEMALDRSDLLLLFEQAEAVADR